MHVLKYRNKLGKKIGILNKALSIQVCLILVASAFVGITPTKVTADVTPQPTISTATNITAPVGVQTLITGLSVSYSGSDAVPISVTSDSGQLSIDESGLSLQWNYLSDTRLSFKGSLADVNVALSRLKYKNNVLTTAHIQVVVAELGGSSYYDPTSQHVYHLNTSTSDQASAKIAADNETFHDFSNTSFGGYLATITSQSENDFVHSFNSGSSWIAASDAVNEGTWVWIDGPELGMNFWQGASALSGGVPVDGAYSNWSTDEPNNAGGQNCSYMFTGGVWDDGGCLATFGHVTEFGTPVNVPNISSTSFNITTQIPTNVVNVNNCEDLQIIAADPASYWYSTIKLTSDVDCGGAVIGSLFADSNYRFHGDFDGQGHTIDNFIIGDSTAANIGLFSYLDSATIENITLGAGAQINGTFCTGSIVGWSSNSSVSNIVSSGSVNDTGGNSGGIIGCANVTDGSTQSVSGNTFSGTVNIANLMDYGGIIGMASTDNNSTLHIDNNSSTVTFTNNYDSTLLGCIVGSAESVSTSKTTINYNSANCDLGSSSYSGGIAGEIVLYSNSVGELEYNTAHTSSASSYVAGGIIAVMFIDNSNSIVSSNTTTGSANNSGSHFIGGVIGAQIDSTNSSSLVEDNSSSIELNSGYDVGGIIGIIQLSDSAANIRRNTNTAVIHSFSEAGGIVGLEDLSRGTLDTQQNISSGSIDGYSSIGGIVGGFNTCCSGPLSNSVTNIVDNYQTGTISATDSDPSTAGVGGIVGTLQNPYGSSDYTTVFNLERNYSTGSINGPTNAGGLVGYILNLTDSQTTINISNSFSTGPVNQLGDSYIGAVVGNNSVIDNQSNLLSSGLYYDQIGSGQSACSSGPGEQVNCTAINTLENPNPDYFKNPANPPFSTWNFINTWGSNPDINGGLPCLQWANSQCSPSGDADGDGVINSVESIGPNGGDANNDGIQDYVQRNVSSLPNAVDGNYFVVQSSCSSSSSVSSAKESLLSPDPYFSYPAGLTNFTTTCSSSGATALITQYYYGNYDPSKLILRKFNPTTGTYTTVDGAVLSTVTIGGQPVLKVVYSVTDGGPLDEDGTANGVIVDPVGLAQDAVGPPNTGVGKN